MQKKEKQLESFIIKQNVPNLLFFGPYMNGKEKICYNFIHRLYPNQEDFNKYVLMINCLTTNGIQTMKDIIKLFSMQIIQKTSGLYFKTIVLQYAEYLTNDAQYSLRRTIEQYNHNTRFILLCEKKHQLLQPICSRFVHYYINDSNTYFHPLLTLDSFQYAKYNMYMKEYEQVIQCKESSTLSVYRIAKRMYHDHFSAHDLLLKQKKHPNYDSIVIMFRKCCGIFRNEILCIFYILSLFRNKSKIQILNIY